MKNLKKRFPEKRILITGSVSGLGEAMAVLFGEQGWRVAVTGRDIDNIKTSAEKVRKAGGDVLPLKIDVTRADDFAAAAKSVEEAWGGLDIFVNNAGVAPGAPIVKTSAKDWHAALDTNLNSIFYGCQAFLPMLQKQKKGHVVIISSSAGVVSAPEMLAYSVSKAGAISFAETMAGEQAKNNIDVTVSCPAAFRSSIFEQKASDISRSLIMQALRDEMTTGKAPTAETVAKYTIGSMEKRALYSFPDTELRWVWRIKRLMPNRFYQLLSWAYKRKVWKFKNNDFSSAVSLNHES